MKDIIRNTAVLYMAIMLICRQDNVIVHIKIYSNVVKMACVQMPSTVLLHHKTR